MRRVCKVRREQRTAKFDVGQKDIGGWCTLCQHKETEERVQLEWRNQEIPRGMRFTNADPRYAGRDDNTQGGDMVMTMEKITQMISYNVESNDNATWLWLTSEQMGFNLSSRGAEEGAGGAEGSDQSES